MVHTYTINTTRGGGGSDDNNNNQIKNWRKVCCSFLSNTNTYVHSHPLGVYVHQTHINICRTFGSIVFGSVGTNVCFFFQQKKEEEEHFTFEDAHWASIGFSAEEFPASLSVLA